MHTFRCITANTIRRTVDQTSIGEMTVSVGLKCYNTIAASRFVLSLMLVRGSQYNHVIHPWRRKSIVIGLGLIQHCELLFLLYMIIKI